MGRSLLDMAVKVVVANMGMLEASHLMPVPKHLLLLMWQLSTRSQDSPCSWSLQDVRTWGLFVKILINKHRVRTANWPDLATWHARAHLVADPRRSLPELLRPVTSNTFEFVTRLSLHVGVDCPVRDVVSLTGLVNLGVLEIIQPLGQHNNSNVLAEFPRVTDAVVREWAGAKEEGGGSKVVFPLLRVLRIWGEDFTTHRSLQYLSAFPSLAVYDVAGHRDDWPKTAKIPQGWYRGRGNTWSDQTNALRSVVDICKSLSGGGDAHAATATAIEGSNHQQDVEGHLDAYARLLACDSPGTTPIQTEGAQWTRYDDLIPVPSTRPTANKLKVKAEPKTDSRESQPERLEPPSDQKIKDLWGFLTYCSVGEISGDAEFTSLSPSTPANGSGSRPHIGPLQLPPRPLVTVRSVDPRRVVSPASSSPLPSPSCFAYHCTFVRNVSARQRHATSQRVRRADDVSVRSAKRSSETVAAGSGSSQRRKLRKKATVSVQDFM